MRTSWWVWACIVMGILTCSAAYQHFNQPSLPMVSPGAQTESPGAQSESPGAQSESPGAQSERIALDQKPEQPFADKDQSRLLDGDSAPAGLEPDRLPSAQKEARLEEAAAPVAIE